MKAIALFFAILIAGFGSCSKVQAAGLADLKFGQYQIADSQWNVYACTQTTTCQIYSKNPGTAYQIPWYNGQLSWSAGDYVKFVATGDTTNPWNAIQYTANGTQKAVMGTGHIINMGTDYFFFVGNDNDTGQLFSMTQGFSNTSGVSWTGTLNPTVSQVDTLAAGGSTTPLAQGETVQSSGPPPPTYPSYVTIGSGSAGNMTFNTNSNITSNQQNKFDVWTNKTITDGNKIYIDQVSGNSNTVTIDQTGSKNIIKGNGTAYATLQGSSNGITINQGVSSIGQNEINFNVVGDSNTLSINQARTTQGTASGTNGHYQNVDINGSNNTLTTQQSNTGGVGGHYMETTISGNQNNITARQTDNGNKIMFTSVTGNNNTIEAVQKGTGQHYLENKLTGNGNSVSALQEGTTANRATLDLTNAGGPASVILQQNGGQNVSVITTCATAGGCAPITVRQGY
jgi:hypothetical protein